MQNGEEIINALKIRANSVHWNNDHGRMIQIVNSVTFKFPGERRCS